MYVTVAIFMMDQSKVQQLCIKFVPVLGKGLQRPSQWFNKPSGTKSWVTCRGFNGMTSSRPAAHQLMMTNTQEDSQAAQLLKLFHELKSSSFRINVRPFTTLLSRWKFVMGHAKGFWRKNWAYAASQPNLGPGSWQLTRTSSVPMSALKFVSSPQTMKPPFPRSSLVMKAGLMVSTLRQSNNTPSRKAPSQQGQKG
jgi:hypothetical protein